MRRPAPRECGPGLAGYSLWATLAVVVVLEFHTFLFIVFSMQFPLDVPSEYRIHVSLLAGCGIAAALWTAVFTLQRIGAHSGAGFRIAGLGLTAHLLSILGSTGLERRGISVYDAAPQVSAVVWLARNVGLAAFAFGIVFVALSSWSDWRLRRTAPAWVVPYEA